MTVQQPKQTSSVPKPWETEEFKELVQRTIDEKFYPIQTLSNPLVILDEMGGACPICQKYYHYDKLNMRWCTKCPVHIHTKGKCDKTIPPFKEWLDMWEEIINNNDVMDGDLEKMKAGIQEIIDWLEQEYLK